MQVDAPVVMHHRGMPCCYIKEAKSGQPKWLTERPDWGFCHDVIFPDAMECRRPLGLPFQVRTHAPELLYMYSPWHLGCCTLYMHAPSETNRKNKIHATDSMQAGVAEASTSGGSLERQKRHVWKLSAEESPAEGELARVLKAASIRAADWGGRSHQVVRVSVDQCSLGVLRCGRPAQGQQPELSAQELSF